MIPHLYDKFHEYGFQALIGILEASMEQLVYPGFASETPRVDLATRFSTGSLVELVRRDYKALNMLKLYPIRR